jgi:CRISPR-associated exonuclease Cas4
MSPETRVVDDQHLIPLSALQHFLYCDRQAALIHVEQVWVDNALTVEGTHLHETVDSLASENRRGLLVRRGMRIRSERLGVTGKADVVEFRAVASGLGQGVELPGLEGLWRVVPVEYKRGKPKPYRADEVQLCAQAMCLEEMFRTLVPAGEIFYGQVRRRHDVAMDGALRELTISTARSLRGMIERREVPIRKRMVKCRDCSLVEVCLPLGKSSRRSARAYLAAQIANGEPA